MEQGISIEVLLNAPHEQAIDRVTAALKAEGFGILTRIDVRATLKEKLGVDFRPYVILGACNPPLAHRALAHRAEAGLLLPCNVTVEEAPGGRSVVRIGDPNVFLAIGGLDRDPTLREVAQEARKRLQRAAEALQKSTG
jgi:uncharacterized protein (DUF302 family)